MKAGLRLLRIVALITAFAFIAALVVFVSGGGTHATTISGAAAGVIAFQFEKRLPPIRAREMGEGQ